MRTRLIALALLASAVVTGVVIAANAPFSYVYRRGQGVYSRISGSAAFDRIGEISKKYGDEFIWFRMNGRNYLIRDAKTLAEARQAFAHLEVLEPSLREVERRLQPFEREMEKIEERVDALGDSLDDDGMSDATREAIEDKLHVAEKAMRAVEEKMRVVEEEMERLENESEKREVIAEDRFQEIVERAMDSGAAQRID